jgi:hypothetical protein
MFVLGVLAIQSLESCKCRCIATQCNLHSKCPVMLHFPPIILNSCVLGTVIRTKSPVHTVAIHSCELGTTAAAREQTAE